MDILGIGMMVADFRQAGMTACVRKRLKFKVKTWSVQALSSFPGNSGPFVHCDISHTEVDVV